MNEQANSRDFCPNELPAIGQQVMQDSEVPNNQQAAPLLQDLNEVPNLEDPAEVLIHPPQVLEQGQDLDWVLMNQEIEMVIDQPEPPEQPILEPVDEPPAPLSAPSLQNINFLHHETPVDMLMNDAGLAVLANQEFQDGHIQNNVQVGMVRIVEGPPPSIVPNLFGNRSTMLPWEKDAHKMKGSISVNIPVDWATFFASLLQSPPHFSWAKEFIMSGSSGLLSNAEQIITVPIPSTCPTLADSSCSKLTDWAPISVEEEEDLDDENKEDLEEEKDLSDELPSQEVSPRPLTKARNAKVFFVETELRRSNRRKIRNKGFKTSSCGKVSYLGCSS